MSRLFLCSLLLICLALFSPLFFLPKGEDITPEAEPTQTLSPVPEAVSDSEYSFNALIDGEVCAVTMEDYLTGSVAAEMPALFELEALKAQAVTIRSYIMNLADSTSYKHGEAVVCSDPSCCKGYISDAEMQSNWGDSYEIYKNKIELATHETDGQYLSYDGEAISAVFHAGSIGETEASSAIWSDMPYLVSVESPETGETVPTLVTRVSLSTSDFLEALHAVRPDAVLSDDPSLWIREITLTDSGRVDSLTLGDTVVSGNEARSIFSLRSTDFDVLYDGEDFVFTVRGYGHGVGMSQEGANLYAADGMGYAEILAHYYPSTVLVSP